MLGAPVPAFPAIRISDLLGITAQKFHQVGGTAVSGIDYFGLAVSVSLETNRLPDHIFSALSLFRWR